VKERKQGKNMKKFLSLVLIGSPLLLQAIVHQTNDISSIVAQNRFVAVKFYTNDCPSCSKFHGIFETASNTLSNSYFAQIDARANIRISRQYDISHVPTVIVFKDGVEVGRTGSMTSPDQFIEFLKSKWQ
jgi:thioredoxin 1